MDDKKQNDFIDKMTVIRDLVNAARRQHTLIQNSKWIQLCTCMDTIEDAQEALDYYNKLDDFDSHSGGYLYIYGLLQSCFVQQDAVKDLYKILFEQDLKFEVGYQELEDIRNTRNDAIGHPTSRNRGKSFHSISRPTISKKKFDLLSDFKKGKMESNSIDLEKIINNQEKNINQILSNIIVTIKKEDNEYKKKFKDNLLYDEFHKIIQYQIEKLYGIISDNATKLKQAEIAIPIIIKVYDKSLEDISERYGSFEDFEQIKFLKVRIDFCLDKISNYLSNDSSYEKLEAELYINQIKCFIIEYEKELKLIDEDFNPSIDDKKNDNEEVQYMFPEIHVTVSS